jgi:hypothetical protein
MDNGWSMPGHGTTSEAFLKALQVTAACNEQNRMMEERLR